MDENEEVVISNADQYFIQNHYRTLSLEDLCQSTGLAPELISSYIEDYESYMKESGINIDDKFTFSVNITPTGSVSYAIQWPSNLQTIETLIPYVGKGLYLLNSGSFKASIIQFLLKYAEERGTYKVVKDIINTWSDQDNNKKNAPIIEPYEVFKGA